MKGGSERQGHSSGPAPARNNGSAMTQDPAKRVLVAEDEAHRKGLITGLVLGLIGGGIMGGIFGSLASKPETGGAPAGILGTNEPVMTTNTIGPHRTDAPTDHR
jgi:hypothetical protein